MGHGGIEWGMAEWGYGVVCGGGRAEGQSYYWVYLGRLIFPGPMGLGQPPPLRYSTRPIRLPVGEEHPTPPLVGIFLASPAEGLPPIHFINSIFKHRKVASLTLHIYEITGCVCKITAKSPLHHVLVGAIHPRHFIFANEGGHLG